MAKRARMRYPRPLAELLRDGFKGLGLAERLREADIWRIWPAVVGPAVARRAQPLRIMNGALTVAVSSGPWMQELTFLKGMMRQKLNEQLGGDVVTEIILTSGRVTEPLPPAEDETPPRKRLTSRQLAAIEAQAAAIPDPETRQAFVELMKTCMEDSR